MHQLMNDKDFIIFLIQRTKEVSNEVSEFKIV